MFRNCSNNRVASLLLLQIKNNQLSLVFSRHLLLKAATLIDVEPCFYFNHLSGYEALSKLVTIKDHKMESQKFVLPSEITVLSYHSYDDMVAEMISIAQKCYNITHLYR